MVPTQNGALQRSRGTRLFMELVRRSCFVCRSHLTSVAGTHDVLDVRLSTAIAPTFWTMIN
jgi:hypothetical protein